MEKISVEGKIMWQSVDGVIRKSSDIIPDKTGWHKVDVEGKIMWESPEGEREF